MHPSRAATPSARPRSVVMQFTVTKNKGFNAKKLPATLNTIPKLSSPSVTRRQVLWDVADANDNPVELLLNGLTWMSDVTEKTVAGSTEDWVLINPTVDTHPIHLHLTQFQLLSRQKMDSMQYAMDWANQNAALSMMGDGMPPWSFEPTPLDVANYLTPNTLTDPDSNEQGWKDTVRMNPGEVTRMRVRFAPIDGSGTYPFDPTVGPGYVRHCHIIDHEGDDMMRRSVVTH